MDVAAAIAQAALVDGRAAAPNALRSMTPRALVRLTGRAVLEAVGGLLGCRPALLVPLAGASGELASVTTPDSIHTDRASTPATAIPTGGRGWRALHAPLASTGPAATPRACGAPLTVIAYDGDRTALPEPAIRAGERAPRGEVMQLSGRHYAAFLDAHEPTVDVEPAFFADILSMVASDASTTAVVTIARWTADRTRSPDRAPSSRSQFSCAQQSAPRIVPLAHRISRATSSTCR